MTGMTVAKPSNSESPRSIPRLVAGDRLTRDEFERRYEAMPELKKAELIEGVVYVCSAVSHGRHGALTARVLCWLGHYLVATPGVDVGDNSTVRLDLDNEPQPDALLRILPSRGGQSSTAVGEYVEGPPELVVEVSASSASYDLHDKKNAYRRNGIREYVVWRVDDRVVDWFVLRNGRYDSLAAGQDGILRSECFPGLWLDTEALLQDDLARVLAVLDSGVATGEHDSFVRELAANES